MGSMVTAGPRKGALFENLAFGVATISTALFAVVVARKTLRSIARHGLGWDTLAALVYLVALWAVLAYLALPRFNRILAAIYVPDYFIGRARTSDGLLGDPINLALLGSGDQIRFAMQSAGWTPADPINLGSALRIVAASVTRRSYQRAPVSPLLVFGRPQEFAYQQEDRGSPARRHHVRFWPCPDTWLLPGGRRVEWLAAGTYDRAVGLSLFTLQVTHKIDSDTDAERDYIVASIVKALPGVTVEKMTDYTSGYHARNGGGDQIETDGMLPIVDVRSVQLPDRRGATRVERKLPGSAGALATDIGRRPVSVGIASVLILLSVLSSTMIGIQEGAYAIPASIDAVEREAFMAMLVVGQLITTLLSASLAWFVFRGHNRARQLIIVLTSVSLVTEFSQYLVAQVPSLPTLVDMTVQILIIHSLTSASARNWTSRRRHRDADA